MPVQNLISTVLDVVYCAPCTQNHGKPSMQNIGVNSYSHSAQSHCFINTDYQRSQKFGIFVKCDLHSTKIRKFKSGFVVIT